MRQAVAGLGDVVDVEENRAGNMLAVIIFARAWA